MTSPPLSEPLDRAAHVDALCAAAVELYRYVARELGPGASGEPVTRTVERAYARGEIIGLRVALCLAMGWDPRADPDKEGRAEEYIQEWHALRHPGDDLF